MEGVQPSGGGLVRFSKNDTLPALVLPREYSPAGVGCHGANVSVATSVCFSPDCPALGSAGESPPVTSSPVLVGPIMVLRPGVPP